MGQDNDATGFFAGSGKGFPDPVIGDQRFPSHVDEAMEQISPTSDKLTRGR